MYDYDHPEIEMKLSGSLDEISGLTVFNDSTLIAVEDETGRLYFLDNTTGDIRRRTKFAGRGDYEGVEVIDDEVYVLRSDGDLFVISDLYSDTPKSKKSENRLTSSCDAEGLGYQSTTNSLLIACKENGGKGMSGFKSIYRYDLESDTLAQAPAYAINVNAKERDEYPARLLDFENKRSNVRGFKPSAVAVHPVTGNIYVVSSVWRVISVLDTLGNLLSVTELDEALYRQPEGLAFDSAGTMYISSEAQGKRARLYRLESISEEE